MQRLHIRGIRQAKYLSKLGHEVYVFTNRFPACLSNASLYTRAQINRVAGPQAIGKSLQFAFLSFFSALKNKEIDIVHISNDPSQRISVLMAFLEKISGVPVVVDMTEHIVEKRMTKGMNWFEVYKERAYERLLCGLAKKIFVISESKKEALLPNFQDKLVYIPNAADTDLYEHRDLDEKASEIRNKVDADCLLLYVEPWAGEHSERVRLMLDSFKLLLKAESSARIKLLLIGKANASLIERIKREGLEKGVFLAGEIDYNQVPAYVKAGDIGIAPYVTYVPLGLGNKVLDYWCAGKSVVTTVGGNRIIQQSDAGVVVQKNAQSMAKGILGLIEDSSYANKLALNGRRLIDEFFNWNIQAKRTIKAYEECLIRDK